MIRFSLIALILLIQSYAHGSNKTISLLGPMFHINFGSQTRYSLGLEGSTWKDEYRIGIDYGFEIEFPNTFRIYSEIETGVVYVGCGAGPVIEFASRDSKIGIQGSAWANYFGGFNFRMRTGLGMETVVAPGLYAKFIVSELKFRGPPYDEGEY